MARFSLVVDIPRADNHDVADVLRRARVGLTKRATPPTDNDPLRLFDNTGALIGTARFEEDQ